MVTVNIASLLHLLHQLFISFDEAKKSLNMDADFVNFDWETVLRSLDFVEGVNALYSLLHGTNASSGLEKPFASGQCKVVDGVLSYEAIRPQRSVLRFSIVHSMIPLHDCSFSVILSFLPKILEAVGIEGPMAFIKEVTRPNGIINLLDIEQALGSEMTKTIAELFSLNSHLCEMTYAGSMEMVACHFEKRYLPSGSTPQFFKEFQTSASLPNSFLNGTYERLMHVQTNLFLGRNHNLSDKPPQTRRVSAPPATILPTITSMGLKRWPSEKSKYFGLDEMLNTTEKGPLWIGPMGVDEMEIIVCLKEPCIITELSVTIRHGSNDLTSPQTMDIW